MINSNIIEFDNPNFPRSFSNSEVEENRLIQSFFNDLVAKKGNEAKVTELEKEI